VLNPAELAEFSAHVPTCARCAPLVASVSDLLTGLHGMEQIEAPRRAGVLDSGQDVGAARDGDRLAHDFGLVRSTTSIRFAYGALSVAATVVLFVTASGFNWRHPKLADLKPAAFIETRTTRRIWRMGAALSL